MQISELKIGQGNINVEGVIKEIGETRTFNKFGRELTVANAILQDDSGNIKLTLWNEEVRKFKDGDKVRIVNGYVNEFQGEKQLTAGKYGKIEKIEGSEGEKEEKERKEIEKADSEETEEEVEEALEGSEGY